MVCPAKTYGIIVHGISTKSVSWDTKGKEHAIQTMMIENAHRTCSATSIHYIGWLTRNNIAKKKHSSIALEFGHQEDANMFLEFGLTWKGQLQHCEIYDRTMRLLQCHRCYKYGHTGTRCRAQIKCGKCSGSHDRALCTSSEKKCAVCGQDHYSWSDLCTARAAAKAKLEEMPKLQRYPNPHPRNQLIRQGIVQNMGTGSISRTTEIDSDDHNNNNAGVEAGNTLTATSGKSTTPTPFALRCSHK